MNASFTTGNRLKQVMKSVAWLIASAATSPLAVPELLLRRLRGGDVMFEGQSQLMALIPGKTGMFLRAAYYHWTLCSCPLDVAIQFGAVFAHSEAKLGHRVYIGVRCSMGRVEIGDDCMLADHVQVLSGRHQHGMSGGPVNFQEQERQFETIRVGNNCWLGAACIVMADIGVGSVIGAGSVVTRPISPGSVAVGSPARVIRSTASLDRQEPPADELASPTSRLSSCPESAASNAVSPIFPPRGELHDSTSA